MLLNRNHERTAFIVLAALSFIYVCLRAVHVPITHDEAVSYFQYVRTGSFQPGFAHWDAGNHILNSAFGHLAYRAFGMAPAAIRAGSVLCYLLFALYVHRTGAWFKDPLIRYVLYATLLLTPFILDFFSLFRGYGPSLAFGLMGLYHLVRVANTGKREHVFWTVMAFTLAGLSSLNILLFWMQALALIVLFSLVQRTTVKQKLVNVGIVLLVGVPPLLYCIWYGEELKIRNMLYYGSQDGLVKGTLGSLSCLVLGTEAWPVVLALAVLFVLAVIAAAYGVGRNVFHEERWMPMRILAVCLVGELAGRTILWENDGVLFPMDRTAAHLVPSSLLLFALALDRLASRSDLVRSAALLLLFLPLRTISGLNVERTVLWPEEHFEARLFEVVQRKQAAMDRPLLISAWNQFDIPWLYARAYAHPQLSPLTAVGYPRLHADLLLFSALHTKAPAGYTKIYSSPDSLTQVLERNEQLRLELVSDSLVKIPSMEGSYFDLWEFPVVIAGGRPALVELALTLTTIGDGPVVQLVSDSKQANGASIMYEALDLHRMHYEWNGETARMVRYFPGMSESDRAKLYLWMINGRRVEGECRVRTYVISN